jgi:hypothetical protein
MARKSASLLGRDKEKQESEDDTRSDLEPLLAIGMQTRKDIVSKECQQNSREAND